MTSEDKASYRMLKTRHAMRLRHPVSALDASGCRSFYAKEPLIIGLFCGQWPIKTRHPMYLRHPVSARWRVLMGHFLQKSPMAIGSFAERDLQLKKMQASSPPCTSKMTFEKSCRSLSEKEPIAIGLFCGKTRHPMHLRHPVSAKTTFENSDHLCRTSISSPMAILKSQLCSQFT